MYHRYRNRAEAGRVIAELVARHPLQGAPLVVALPRGGVPVGYEVAQKLAAPLDLLVVRKIGAPGNAELACGAFILGGEVVWNTKVMKALRVTRQDLEDTYQDEVDEAKHREEALRTPDSPPLPLAGRSVIIVDDGLATGATMKAAVRGVKAEHAREIVVAVPMGPVGTCREIEEMGCDLICDQRIDEQSFSSVGEWYQEFPQVSTDECREIVVTNRRERESLWQQKGEPRLSSF